MATQRGDVVSYVYRIEFPIEDDSLRMSQVINQALLIFEDEALRRGFVVTGPANAWVHEDRVICEAPAEQVPGRKPKRADLYGARIRELNGHGLTDGQIAERLSIGTSTVQAVRKELDIPPVTIGRPA